MMMERDPRRFGSITFMVYYMIDIRLGLTACWWLLAIRSAAPLNCFLFFYFFYFYFKCNQARGVQPRRGLEARVLFVVSERERERECMCVSVCVQAPISPRPPLNHPTTQLAAFASGSHHKQILNPTPSPLSPPRPTNHSLNPPHHPLEQLAEFAGGSMGGRLSQRYAEMVPPLEDLLLSLKLDPEVRLCFF